MAVNLVVAIAGLVTASTGLVAAVTALVHSLRTRGQLNNYVNGDRNGH